MILDVGHVIAQYHQLSPVNTCVRAVRAKAQRIFTPPLKYPPPSRILGMQETTTGDDMVSTEVANPEAHAEDSDHLVNPAEKLIVANDDNYAMAA